jgi:hypothetical protein
MSAASALLARLCAAAVRTLPVDGAAISAMTAGGHQGPICATDATAAAIEELQFTLGEGPALDAFGEARPVLVADLAGPTDGVPSLGRWPAFVTAVTELDVRAVFTYPLVLGAADLGVMMMYAREPVLFDAPSRAAALRLADAAALALLDALHGANGIDGDDGSDGHQNGYKGGHVDGVLNDVDGGFFRSEVYQAAGMTMVQLDVSIEVALARIRGHAYALDTPVLDVARAIVQRELRLPADT